MTKQSKKNTKYEILQCATRLFLEKGYTDSYITTIAKELQISTGNIRFSRRKVCRFDSCHPHQ